MKLKDTGISSGPLSRLPRAGGEVPDGPAHIPHPVFKDLKLRCRRCRQGDEVYPYWTSPANKHNPHRQFFTCARCNDDHTRGRFICWADGQGVYSSNRPCYCGRPSREDVVTGRRWGGVVGRRFWSCAVGWCELDEKEDLQTMLLGR